MDNVILLLGFSAICYVISLLQQANKQLRKINIGNNNISKSEIDELIGMHVRDLKIDTKLSLASLECEALRQNKMIIKPFGRFKARNISSKDFFQVASQLLSEDQYALVGGVGS